MPIILSRGTAPAPNGFVVPPVSRGLRAWFTFDTDPGSFGRNRARGQPNAKIVGSPIAYATHGRFKGLQNYLQTQIADSDEITIMVVGRAVITPTSVADGALLVGGYVGTSQTPGITGNATCGNLFFNNGTTVIASASRNGGAGTSSAGSVTVAGTSPTSWAIRAMRAKTGDVTKVFDLTAGVSNVGTSVLQRVLSDTKIRIGSATVDFAGECDISVVGIWDKYLTDVEIEQNAVPMRNRMQRLGISV